MLRMWIWALLLFSPGALVSGLRLLNITGPSVIVNGTTPLLVLDCEYELTEIDKHGLVVKWYFNRGPFPIYQWIPNHRPAAQGILKGRVDETYQVSDNPYMKHRALAIRNPTIELGGEYTCWLSSFQSEKMERKDVHIYSPAELTLTWTKPTDKSVLIFCKASGGYPEPEMAIYRRDHTENRIPIEGADVELSQEDNGGYSKTLQLELYDYELNDETVFECDLKIPGTKFQVQKQILYYPATDYDYENDDMLPYYFDEHQYNYDEQPSHQGGAPTTTTTTPSTTTTTTTTTSSTFVAVEDNKNIVAVNDDKNLDIVSKEHSNKNELADQIQSSSVIDKGADTEISSANKAVPITAEESPRVAESVSSGERSSWSLILLFPAIVIQHFLQ